MTDVPSNPLKGRRNLHLEKLVETLRGHHILIDLRGWGKRFVAIGEEDVVWELEKEGKWK